MEFIQIEVSPREALGTANASRLRRAGNIPAVLYGMKRPNISLTISGDEIDRFLKTGSHLVELRLGDKTRPAILREMQMDPVTDRILHIDFHRVDKDAEVEDEVPVTYKGRAKGEGEGGVCQVLRNSVAVRARPRDLPREYVIDISHLGLGDQITLDDFEAREGVTLTDEAETVFAQVVALASVEDRLAEGTEEPEAAEEEAAEGAEEAEGAEDAEASEKAGE